MRETAGSVAAPAARRRNCRRGIPSIKHSRWRQRGNLRRKTRIASSQTAASWQLIAALNHVQSFFECSPADGTNAAADKERGSAHPLAARLTGYLSLVSMRKGRRPSIRNVLPDAPQDTSRINDNEI